MPTATLRPKGQITIPVQILKQWGINPYEKVDITYQNGVVTLIPTTRKNRNRARRLDSFVGIGRGCWGDSLEEVQNAISEVKDSWER